MEQSFNPIAERRLQNQETIAKSFISGNQIDTNNIHKSHNDNVKRVQDDFLKSFGGKFDMFQKSTEDDLSGTNGKVLLTHKAVENSLVSEVDKIKRQRLVGNLADNLQKSNVDTLEKGEIMDKLVYGYGANNETFKFVKTGKEIQTMLPACIEALAEQKGEIMSQMEACVEAAGVEPTENYSPSSFKMIKMKRYPYELIRQEYNEVNRTYTAMTESQIACQKYNDLCWSLRGVLEDILACKIILGNVEDDKKYNLTISQLVALTLGDDLINDNFGKGEIDELEKGGAGSRGGKVIGYTKSGKPIYEDAKNPEHKKFTTEDHNDAANLHSNGIKEDTKNRKGSSHDASIIHHAVQASEHRKAAIKKIPAKERKEINDYEKVRWAGTGSNK